MLPAPAYVQDKKSQKISHYGAYGATLRMNALSGVAPMPFIVAPLIRRDGVGRGRTYEVIVILE